MRRFLADPWLWAVVGVTVVGAFLRLYRLTELPPGIHGDEGWLGIQANRVLDEGWIGSYVVLGFGNNAGGVYWTAPFVGLVGDTVLAIRLPMALLGVATIPVAYLAFKEMAGKKAGLIGAFLLAVSMWHISYSRTAFLAASSPLIELAVLASLFWALRTKRRSLFVLAGVLLGLGVHSYVTYPLFVAGLYLFLVWAFVRGQFLPRTLLLQNVVLLHVAAFVMALPLILEALDSSSLLRNDPQRPENLIFNTPAYEQAETLFDRVDVVASQAWQYLLSLTWEGNFDGVDGIGLTPILDRFTIVLALAGLAYMAAKWRRPGHVLVWLMILTLPLAAVFTVEGMYRRTLGLVPFISLAAALPLALAWEQALKLKPLGRWAVLGAVVLIVGLITQVNVTRYFDAANSSEVSWVFVEDLTKASQYVADLPGRPYIYLYSARFFFAYETQRYLLPDRPGEDRSREHGEFSLEADRNQDVVFVFLGPYFDLLPQVEALYPGGIAHEENDSNGQPLFHAYYLPSQAQARPPVDG